MHASLCPHVTTGIAVVSAGVIAVTPIAPPPSDVRLPQISNPAVQLTAAPNPLEYYPQVLQETLGNAGTLLLQYPAAGAAYLGALIADPVQVLQNTVLAAAFVLVPPASLIFATYATAIASTPVANAIGATVVALNDVSDAVAGGNPADLVNAIVDIPARVLDGLLNGGYPYLNSSAVGLFTPYLPYESSGPLALPLFLVDFIVSYGRQSLLEPPTTFDEVGIEIAAPTTQAANAIDVAGVAEEADDAGDAVHNRIEKPSPTVELTKPAEGVGGANGVAGRTLPPIRAVAKSVRDVVKPIRDAASKANNHIASDGVNPTQKSAARDAAKKVATDIKNAVAVRTSAKEPLSGHTKAATGDN